MKAHRLGVIFLTMGMLLILAGMLALILQGAENLSIGGCILIGPVPICFGYGQNPLLMLVATISVLLIILVIAYLSLRDLQRELMRQENLASGTP